MHVLTEPDSIQNINDINLRQLLEMRLDQLGSVEGIIIVEQGDSIESLENVSGCPIQRDLFDECRFGDDEFTPAFEVLEDHGYCYEMVFVMSDDGGGAVLFIPKQEGVDADLLSLCQAFAIPATSSCQRRKSMSNDLVGDLVAKLDDNLREAFEERAGIIEFDANLPRDHAECLALLNVLVSHPEAMSMLFKHAQF